MQPPTQRLLSLSYRSVCRCQSRPPAVSDRSPPGGHPASDAGPRSVPIRRTRLIFMVGRASRCVSRWSLQIHAVAASVAYAMAIDRMLADGLSVTCYAVHPKAMLGLSLQCDVIRSNAVQLADTMSFHAMQCDRIICIAPLTANSSGKLN